MYRTPLHKPVEFVDAFPQALRSYIHHVKDVAADGHCGYRAIAALLGYGEDGWVQVRRDLLNELESYSVHYSALYGSENRVYELKHSLAYFGPDANFDRWMTMPDMGHIIASCYDVVLVHLSNVQCLTFLPLRSRPLPLSDRREIAIGFINRHFVQVFYNLNISCLFYKYVLIYIYLHLCAGILEAKSSNSPYSNKLG